MRKGGLFTIALRLQTLLVGVALLAYNSNPTILKLYTELADALTTTGT